MMPRPGLERLATPITDNVASAFERSRCAIGIVMGGRIRQEDASKTHSPSKFL